VFEHGGAAPSTPALPKKIKADISDEMVTPLSEPVRGLRRVLRGVAKSQDVPGLVSDKDHYEAVVDFVAVTVLYDTSMPRTVQSGYLPTGRYLKSKKWATALTIRRFAAPRTHPPNQPKLPRDQGVSACVSATGHLLSLVERSAGDASAAL
jgi:hypothetical protein